MQARRPLPVERIDHLLLRVGNARQASYFYQKAFGFRCAAYSGPETGVRDCVSYLLQQGSIRLVFQSALGPASPIADSVLRHGDGVHDIALEVQDVEACYHEALLRGARGVVEPVTYEDPGGMFRRAAISTYGDTVHSFIERRDYRGTFAPGYVPVPDGKFADIGLAAIDHVVGNVEDGKMGEWADFYGNVFGFTRLVSFDDKDVSTEYSSLRSVVMQSPGGEIKLPINEPAPGRGKSQIQEYLDFYGGPGVQHIALRTESIIPVVDAMRRRNVDFLQVPESYYERLPERIGIIQEPLDELRRLGVLADRDEKGYLLQIFTQPVQDRPTLFFEVIQREGSDSFGRGNFKALFEAVERQQARRGNL